jgi:hypothetical protein
MRVQRLVGAVADGAREAGAEVRLRRVPELAPPEAIASNPAWQAHVEATREAPGWPESVRSTWPCRAVPKTPGAGASTSVSAQMPPGSVTRRLGKAASRQVRKSGTRGREKRHANGRKRHTKR